MTDFDFDALAADMGEQLAYFRARPTTKKGEIALERFERELFGLRALLGRIRGEPLDAAPPRSSETRVPAGATLLAADD